LQGGKMGTTSWRPQDMKYRVHCYEHKGSPFQWAIKWNALLNRVVQQSSAIVMSTMKFCAAASSVLSMANAFLRYWMSFADFNSGMPVDNIMANKLMNMEACFLRIL
jgi:hypothetical protein